MIFQIRIKSYPKNMSTNFLPNMFIHFYCTCFSDNFLSEIGKSENKKNIFQKMIFQIRIKSYPKNMSTNFLPNMYTHFYCTCFSDNFLSEIGKPENKKIFFKKMIFQIRIKSYPKNMSTNFLPNMFTHFYCTCFSDDFLSKSLTKIWKI